MKISLVLLLLLLIVTSCQALEESVVVDEGQGRDVAELIENVAEEEPESMLPEEVEIYEGEEDGDVRIKTEADFNRHMELLYEIAVYYAGLNYEVNLEKSKNFPLVEEERERVEELVGYGQAGYENATRTSIDKESLLWYAELGTLPLRIESIVLDSYPVTYSGVYGNVPYVNIDGEEVCLVAEDVEGYDEYIEDRYFKDIKYSLANIQYNQESRTVEAIITTNIDETYWVKIILNADGLIERVQRSLL